MIEIALGAVCLATPTSKMMQGKTKRSELRVHCPEHMTMVARALCEHPLHIQTRTHGSVGNNHSAAILRVI